jgi:aminopeptidase N
MTLSKFFLVIFVLIISTGNAVAGQPDPYSYANSDEIKVTNIDLNLDVSFEKKQMQGTAILSFERVSPDVNVLVLDSKYLIIEAVERKDENGSWQAAPYTLSKADERLGSALSISLDSRDNEVRVSYISTEKATGIQWLGPEQTSGKQHPYMFSQSQDIHARTWIPLQDTPSVRQTFTAVIHTPNNLRAVMGAGQDVTAPRQSSYRFDMPQPIPSYLFAIAVGDIEFQAISDIVGIYAEPDMLAASVAEFDDTPAMITATQSLYGPYLWGRYDLLILPPSFPYGGMENPRLSFITPTSIAGDKSLVALIAHELAHSWSGNLVTNKLWIDSWLNEGFTSYVENRVMEIMFGRDRAVMEQLLSLDSLKASIAENEPRFSQLIVVDEDNDGSITKVQYSKGSLFLVYLEEKFGRAAFDPFLKSYFDKYAFQAVTTDDFLNYLKAELMDKYPDVLTSEQIQNWIYETGLPEDAPVPHSVLFAAVEAQQASWLSGDIKATDIKTQKWSAQEWLRFLGMMPSDIGLDKMDELDSAFNLTKTGNNEVVFVWLKMGIQQGYEPSKERLESFLSSIGRNKFIFPLYVELMKSEDGAKFAKRVYKNSRAGYYPISHDLIDPIVMGGGQ